MSRDFLYKEQLHPLGTSLLQESYTSSLTPLAEEYGLAEKLRFKERGIWKTNFANAHLGSPRRERRSTLKCVLLQVSKARPYNAP